LKNANRESADLERKENVTRNDEQGRQQQNKHWLSHSAKLSRLQVLRPSLAFDLPDASNR
jgi:hypothetical protein